eukprot:CAMPEP_0202788038 /NCGR_PEP_ID=MMETSP1388-20130828/73831_1 /ASSEMBLY_ACC=CAM_ASM_000864 /TAXON_ID=37098 /ORGANISM="Isochrysis sp, Strain CCMP1244" /LENGTH=46 /DNA_ID= /DNA_START= /DNA_END= /DNA_ORIENTATION=
MALRRICPRRTEESSAVSKLSSRAARWRVLSSDSGETEGRKEFPAG